VLNSRFRTVQNFLQDTSENLIRDVGRWIKGVSIRFGLGAILTLMAIFALANGLALGLVELGLPPVAAWLILTAVLGGSGFALFKGGSRKGIAREVPRGRRAGLTVQIVRSPRGRRTAYRFRRRVRSPGRVRSK
jgi:hypothetical protein